jgi:hypothetical protein
MVAAHTWTDAHESQCCETSRRELHECPKRGVFWDLELSKVANQILLLNQPKLPLPLLEVKHVSHAAGQGARRSALRSGFVLNRILSMASWALSCRAARAREAVSRPDTTSVWSAACIAAPTPDVPDAACSRLELEG